MEIQICHIFGLDAGCSKKEVKKAYREMSLKFHPDKVLSSEKQPVATKIFHKIQEAYDAFNDGKTTIDADKFSIEYFSDKNGRDNLIADFQDGNLSKIESLFNNIQKDCNINYHGLFSLKPDATSTQIDSTYNSLKKQLSTQPIALAKLEEVYKILSTPTQCSPIYQDGLLRHYYGPDNNSGLKGLFYDLSLTKSKSMNLEELASYDSLRHFLRTNPNPKAALITAKANGLSETITNCLRHHEKVTAKTSEEVCGRYTLHPEGEEIAQKHTQGDTLSRPIKYSFWTSFHSKFFPYDSSKETLIALDPKVNYYQVLGLNENASLDEIDTKCNSMKLYYGKFGVKSVSDKIHQVCEIIGKTEHRENYDNLLQAKKSIEDHRLGKMFFARAEEYSDSMLRKYFVDQNSGFKGYLYDNFPSKMMSDKRLADYDPILHALKINNDFEDAIEAMQNLQNVDTTAVIECLEKHKDEALQTPLEICGKFAPHPEDYGF